MIARPAAFGVYAETIDGQDVEAVYSAAKDAVERGRSGRGPTFLLCNTYRYHGHHVGDISRAYYRPKQEEQQWVTERDPITLLTNKLLEGTLADRAALDEIRSTLAVTMDAAVAAAIAAPYPEPAEASEDVYA
jgi:pyruvate dehydrogenase E1 component alpha subunit